MRPAWALAAAAVVAASSICATSTHLQHELPAVFENGSSFPPTQTSWNRSSTYNTTRGPGATSNRDVTTSGGGFDEEADLWQAMRVIAGVVAVLLCISIAGAAFHRRQKLQRRMEMRRRFLPPTMEILEAESKGWPPRLPTSPHASATLDRRIRKWIASVPYGGESVAPSAAAIPTIAGRVSPPAILEDAEVAVFVRTALSPVPLSPSPPRSPQEPADSLPHAEPLDTHDLINDPTTDAGRSPTLNAFCTLPWVGRYGRSEVRT